MSLRLIIFDVDGTLVDSQGTIHTCMTLAFEAAGHSAPLLAAVRNIVGLSLPQAMAQLAPDLDAETQAALVEGYKAQFARMRLGQGEGSPLFPGARTTLDALNAQPETLLGVATGKSRRGLVHLMEAHDLTGLFVTTQVADDHPSKPHPSMVLTALAETGVAPKDAVVIGDTTYDMEMAAGAGVPFVGVSWGYHPTSRLTQSIGLLEDFEDLAPLLRRHFGAQT